jgi:hypothetical protein
LALAVPGFPLALAVPGVPGPVLRVLAASAVLAAVPLRPAALGPVLRVLAVASAALAVASAIQAAVLKALTARAVTAG